MKNKFNRDELTALDYFSITNPTSESPAACSYYITPTANAAAGPLMLSGTNRNVITNTENSASDFARSSRDKAYPAMISGPSCFMLSTGGKNETADTADN